MATSIQQAGAVNPYWLAWEKAGAPTPSADFPRAGAFILWMGQRRCEFEKAHGFDGYRDSLKRQQMEPEFARWLSALATPEAA